MFFKSLLISIISSLSIANAQQLINADNQRNSEFSFNLLQNSSIVNQYKDLHFTPKIELKKSDGTLDTLFEYAYRAKSVNVYECYDQNNNAWPITGTNGMFHLVGQKFEIEGSANIVGALVGFAYKQIVQTPDTMYCLVFGPDPDKSDLPKGEVIAGTTYLTSQVDTSISELKLTPIMFPNKGLVTNKFNVSVQVFSGIQTFDLVAIYSSEQKDGLNEKKAFFSRMTQQSISSENYDHFDTKQIPNNLSSTELPDFDLMIIPIIERLSSSVNDALKFGSLTINSVYPLPATNNINFDINSNDNAEFSISIYDIKGNFISSNILSAHSGNNKFQISTENLSSGDYLYIIEKNGNRISGKFPIIK